MHSTSEQGPSRALAAIDALLMSVALTSAITTIENESGSRLDRPELFRLLNDCRQNDILLIEDAESASRLTGETGTA